MGPAVNAGETTQQDWGDRTEFILLPSPAMMSSWPLGLLGASALPVNVNPHGGEGNREARLRETLWRGRTTSAFRGEAVSQRAEV